MKKQVIMLKGNNKGTVKTVSLAVANLFIRKGVAKEVEQVEAVKEVKPKAVKKQSK